MPFKKSILFAAALLAVHVHHLAQTLTAQACNPVFNDQWKIARGNYLPPGAAGQNQVWNFANATYSTTNFMYYGTDPNDYPSILSIAPNANFAWAVNGVGNYYYIDSNGIELLGAGSSAANSVETYSNSKSEIRYPFSVGSTYNDTYSNVFAANKPYQIITQASTTVTAEGTGTLILPNGVYPNCLRVRTLETNTMSSLSYTGYGAVETFKWYTPGIHTELLSIVTHTNLSNNLQGATLLYYLDNLNNVGIQDNDPKSKHNSVFYNQIQRELTIQTADAMPALVELFSIDGKKLMQVETNKSETRLDLDQLRNGLYLIKWNQGKEQVVKKITLY